MGGAGHGIDADEPGWLRVEGPEPPHAAMHAAAANAAKHVATVIDKRFVDTVIRAYPGARSGNTVRYPDSDGSGGGEIP
jgi:hypothetical protein